MSLADDVYMANSHSIIKNCKIYAANLRAHLRRWGGGRTGQFFRSIINAYWVSNPIACHVRLLW
jgi:hypothetical protein